MPGFFSKERSLQRKHRKWGKKLHNIYAQTQDRQYAAHQLASLGTDEAVGLLLGRFEKRLLNHTQDTEEKQLVHDLLVNLGSAAVDPTIAHLKGPALNVNWPLRVLSNFLSRDRIAEILSELLEEMDTEYTRNPEKKHELVLTAAEYQNERLGRALLPMLDDASEEIRFLAVDAILKAQYPFAMEPIMQRLAGEEESIRIRMHILEQIVQTDWTVKGYRPSIEENLPEGYAITRTGTIRRRG
ncbi:MAG: hypothetical protein JW797_11820 [Bradymonadales bacterium]|nr:hypothetical protein [Bradymonadales bacterium]